MPIRMAALNLSATGATKSRKAIPKDDPTRTGADSVDQQLYSLKAERLATVSIIGC